MIPSQINKFGLDIIRADEGLRLKAYMDQAGVWTIGFGHCPAKMGQTITEAEAETLLAGDVSFASAAVYGATHDVPTTSNQFSAMVSLVYNVGVGAFKTSTVLRLHRAKDYVGAADAFLMFDKVRIDGTLVIDPPLLRRRKQERALYLTPDAGVTA